MPLDKAAHVPESTYRVQLHGKFTFVDLAALDSYFSELGISDLYLSPIFTAVPGSQHGYDVTDYGEINPELGGHDGFKALAATLHSGNHAIILDFVPNHMGIAGLLNQWWRDVLEFRAVVPLCAVLRHPVEIGDDAGPSPRACSPPPGSLRKGARAGRDHPDLRQGVLAPVWGHPCR